MRWHRLAIGEARGFAPVEHKVHERLRSAGVHVGVALFLVEGLIEDEFVLFRVLGQVHLRGGRGLGVRPSLTSAQERGNKTLMRGSVCGALT